MFSEIRSTKIAASFATCVALLFSPLACIIREELTRDKFLG